MSERPPWNLLQAVFWLLAGLLSVELLVTLWTTAVCSWLILRGSIALGGCNAIGATVRDIWSEALSALLALMLAAKPGPPPPPPDLSSPTNTHEMRNDKTQ